MSNAKRNVCGIISMLLLPLVGATLAALPGELHRVWFASDYQQHEGEIVKVEKVVSSNGKSRRTVVTVRTDVGESQIRSLLLLPIPSVIFGGPPENVGRRLRIHANAYADRAVGFSAPGAIISIILRILGVIVICVAIRTMFTSTSK